MEFEITKVIESPNLLQASLFCNSMARGLLQVRRVVLRSLSVPGVARFLFALPDKRAAAQRAKDSSLGAVWTTTCCRPRALEDCS